MSYFEKISADSPRQGSSHKPGASGRIHTQGADIVKTLILKRAIGCLTVIGLVSCLRAGAEPLLEGRVRLASGSRQPGRR